MDYVTVRTGHAAPLLIALTFAAAAMHTCGALPTPATPIAYTRLAVGRGIELDVAVAGSGATPMILLHGFPECSWFWRGVIDPLLQANSSLRLCVLGGTVRYEGCRSF